MTSTVATQTRPTHRGSFSTGGDAPVRGAAPSCIHGPTCPATAPPRPTCEALGGVRLRRVLSVLAPETAPAPRRAI
eukprot:10757404-Lingulodinium_polyedra.AAC.1